MFKKRTRPVREPHPDPRMETRLQRVIALRESAARKADLSRQYANEIDDLSDSYRGAVCRNEYYPAELLESRIKDLQKEIGNLEAEIDAIHEAIAERTAELNNDDISFL